MIRVSLLALVLASAATAATAQAADPHAGHGTPAASNASADPHAGHAMPQAPAADPHAGHTMPAPAARAPAADPHAGHQMAAPPTADQHAGHATPPTPAAADPHAGHRTSAPPVADPHAGHAMPPPAADPHAGHQMGPAAADPNAGHAMGAAAGPAPASSLPVGDTPPPAVIRDNLADQVFGVGPMDRARTILANEHGASRVSKVMVNIAEYQADRPGGGYRWDGEAWFGGDLNRVVLRTEGEGNGDEGLEAAEGQLLYSRPIARYTDVQVGVRHDFEGPSRTYATVGFETMFPYWFEAEGGLFVSDRGDLTARLEGSYDLRLTQRLILQPEAELNFSAQDIPALETGSGLTSAELGLRLRYEIRREFAPYIGVSYERSFGSTADYARRHGEDVESTTFVAGVRAFF